MKRIQLTVIVLAILGLAFVAYARTGADNNTSAGAQANGSSCCGSSQSGCGGGMMGKGMMGGSGFAAIDEAKAKEIFTSFIEENLKGSKLGKIEAVKMPRGTMYTAEVKDSKGKVTFYHLTMRGFVRGPFETNVTPAQQGSKI